MYCLGGRCKKCSAGERGGERGGQKDPWSSDDFQNHGLGLSVTTAIEDKGGFCVGVRVTNVYVPIYYKKIVDGLAAGVVDSSHWPWREVTLWFLLKMLQGGGQGSLTTGTIFFFSG
jgi:hypothetical protein